MTDTDVARARALTLGCGEVVHLNNAGAALPPAPVTDIVVEHLRAEAMRGGYEAAEEAAPRVDAVYRSIAALIGAETEDVSITDSATRAWQAVFYSIPFVPGDRILTCKADYASNAIALLQTARRTGAEIEVVADDESGQVDVEDLRRRLDGRVRLITMTHVPTQGGLVNPAEQVGEIAEEAGIPFLLDACQSAGQLELDVARLRCDALSATGRKYLRGPRGTGFLYTSPRLRKKLEPAVLDLHSATWTAPDAYQVHEDGRRFELWEKNVAAVLGLGAAVDHALSWGLDAIEERVSGLAAGLRTALADIPGVTVHDQGVRRCGIVTFSLASLPSARLRRLLGAENINTSLSRRESAQHDFTARDLPEMIRASVHYYNTEDELSRLVDAVARSSRRRAG
ncbi:MULTISPECIES: aminotransferase class V-fold PLP-dependent enzyme [Actinoalloteichus]|uniref:Selenocysteine lyase n=1 Tax=Actinoalloteichus fjordicus TaxID=1612552 RepID=A0AAC9LDH0_9PSEU|nr:MULTISPECIES: aminotransferase class V-fold PLP-dependent enzyme [Actinoalloteichus]APU14309.1 selenocysteine lyase [Actinoalloteichus fjordicus]APU20278.1 selenocysteine lyase [Actinoalloteichus sp. GBA129-24]